MSELSLVKVRPLQDPIQIVLPNKHRTLDGIAPDARATLRELLHGQKPWPLFTWGSVGVGKTCFGLVTIDHYGGKYWTVPDLCDYLISITKVDTFYEGATGGKITPRSVWEDWDRASVAILDELGARSNISDFHYETVKKAIDSREGKPAIFISNVYLDQIAKLYDDRIASRLSAGTVIHLEGDDRRLR